MRQSFMALACALLALEAAAQTPNPFNAGQARYIAGDYRGAYELWLPAAEAGDPHAQYSIGVLYQLGQGVDRDLTEAARWYARAAWQRYGPAEEALRALAPQLRAPGFDGWPPPDRKRDAAWSGLPESNRHGVAPEGF